VVKPIGSQWTNSMELSSNPKLKKNCNEIELSLYTFYRVFLNHIIENLRLTNLIPSKSLSNHFDKKNNSKISLIETEQTLKVKPNKL
jgi:hypothetical protein